MSTLLAICAILAVLVYCPSFQFFMHVSPHDIALHWKRDSVSSLQIMGDQELVLPPLPELLDMSDWLLQLLQRSNEVWHRFGNDRFNYRSLVAIGLYSRKEIYLPSGMVDPTSNKPYPAQEPKKFDKAALQSLNAHFPPGEISLCEHDF